MAKKSHAKLKILYVKEILETSRTVTMRELLEGLSERGLPSERKSVSDDLKLLSAYGLPIGKQRRGRATEYFLQNRP